jgi:type IV secretory pathway TraG/TraD family ATPase VirD4
VLDAAEEMADEYPHGRLPVPLTVVLDEAANVCRIQELPNLYSHYGSRGIFLVTILQSWAQGVRVWSEDGMKALWTASTFCMVGAGQKDTAFLKAISDSLGERYVTEYSVSHGKGKNSGSRSTQQHLRAIMTVDDLVSLRPFEAIVIASGEDPFIGRTVPWFNRKEMTEPVKASIAKHEPQGTAVAVTV